MSCNQKEDRINDALDRHATGDPPIFAVGDCLFQEPLHLVHPRFVHLGLASRWANRVDSNPVADELESGLALLCGRGGD
jgi:hypothetical protein